VCNDGSPGAYYFHKANDPAQANVWLVYLEGGDWCYSAQSCAMRFNVGPQFMTTDKWPGVISLGGIFDENPTKSPWAGANKARCAGALRPLTSPHLWAAQVYVGYCSSDAWVGDVPASEATFGLAFRGQRIISATLGSLVLNHQLGATSGQRLLFSGCSAGGRGAMFTIDYVPAILHDLGVQDGYVQLQGLFDSPVRARARPRLTLTLRASDVGGHRAHHGHKRANRAAAGAGGGGADAGERHGPPGRHLRRLLPASGLVEGASMARAPLHPFTQPVPLVPLRPVPPPLRHHALRAQRRAVR